MKFTKENVINEYGKALDYDEEMLENDDFVLSVEEMEEQPQLNENQRFVLEWLKKEYDPFSTEPFIIPHLMIYSGNTPFKVAEAYEKFCDKDEFEVLQAFGQWGLEELGNE